MKTLQDQVYVELVGRIIIARIRGEVTKDLLKERHERILHICHDSGCRHLLLDDLEMNPPSIEAVEAQQALNPELNDLGVRIAIVVPNSRAAYLARMQFGEDHHRVFYNDMEAAFFWLGQMSSSTAAPSYVDH